jgi:hypothetical protein
VSVDVTALVGGAVGGAAIQSVLNPLFGQVHERRAFRADVLAKLAIVENKRWATAEKPDQLREAVASLRAASLVAGLDKRVVDFHVLTAGAGWQVSFRSWQEWPDEDGGSVPSTLGTLISDSAAVLAAYAWRPYWRRAFLRRDLARLEKQKTKVTAELKDMSGAAVDWGQIWAVRQT